jgi:DNA replication protein DnaC
MTDSEPYTDEERRARYDLWVADEAEARMERLLAKRPAKFAAPGALHPDLAAWSARFMAGDVENVKIVGNVGSGKSWNLWRLAQHLVEHGFLGRFEIMAAHKLKRLITPPVDLEALDKLAAADLLALDDVAAIRVSDWDADLLYGLFDDRWSTDKPILVASNLPVLGDVIGPRATSRLSDNLITVKITGPDRRGSQ